MFNCRQDECDRNSLPLVGCKVIECDKAADIATKTASRVSGPIADAFGRDGVEAVCGFVSEKLAIVL